MAVRLYKLSGRSPDFRIHYKWLCAQDIDPPQRLFQHMRSDWLYAEDDPRTDGIHIIYPEFEDRTGRVIADGERVLDEGTATMWILFEESRPRHRERIAAGSRGYLVVGSNRIAEAEVTAILGLAESSISISSGDATS